MEEITYFGKMIICFTDVKLRGRTNQSINQSKFI